MSFKSLGNSTRQIEMPELNSLLVCEPNGRYTHLQAIRILVSIQLQTQWIHLFLRIKMGIKCGKQKLQIGQDFTHFSLFIFMHVNERVCVILRKCHLCIALHCIAFISANCPWAGMRCIRIYLAYGFFFQLIRASINQCVAVEKCTFIAKFREMVANDGSWFLLETTKPTKTSKSGQINKTTKRAKTNKRNPLVSILLRIQ